MPEKLPARIYRCPECGYATELRFVLKNHLQNVHGYGKRESLIVAAQSEYWLNPHYTRAYTEEEDEV